MTWYYLNVREALTKAQELLMKLEPEERLVVGTVYCGQNLRIGEILELVSSEDDLEIGGVVMLRLWSDSFSIKQEVQ